jgi:hypothetical protein
MTMEESRAFRTARLGLTSGLTLVPDPPGGQHTVSSGAQEGHRMRSCMPMSATLTRRCTYGLACMSLRVGVDH